ncbi:4500_t:CDS:2 [Ambispora leptoticha]|uniref:Cytochrome b-c1 complex subunit 8 n=1 Tax=Ambispora leptoticha TaxID=144679 RepID=A0A9N9B8L8_9GLOM|nr:4500_t:CDS:2 [Ambispora leptoticha]
MLSLSSAVTEKSKRTIYILKDFSLKVSNSSTIKIMGGIRHAWWGHLGGPVQRGVVTYSLSPYEQRAFAGALKHGVFNTYRRFMSQLPYIGIPGLFAYGIYRWGTERYKYLQSKAGHAELQAILA